MLEKVDFLPELSVFLLPSQYSQVEQCFTLFAVNIIHILFLCNYSEVLTENNP